MQSMRTTVRTVTVSQEESGRKLLSFLQAHLEDSLPQGLFMRLVRTGQVRVDGKRCKPFDRVLAGQDVRIPPVTVQVKEARSGAPTNTAVDIVAEDAEMLVLNKPAGLPVHPGTGWTDSVQTRLAARFQDAAFTPTPVHRLDRDTSGLLLCAKTHDFLRRMHANWADVTKAYLCRVHGEWSAAGWTTIRARLAKQDFGCGEKMAVGQGKDSVTHVHALVVTTSASLLLVVLGTGRTHQIRAHLASLGHPLVGDGKYGSGGESLRLHATVLAWPGHVFTTLPDWDEPHRVDPSLAEDITHRLTTAPLKENI
jgi:23S rRNA pseudouridine955/2504/2580 synthase